jgi:hypothetical protein
LSLVSHLLLVLALALSVSVGIVVVVPIPTCNPPHKQGLVRLEDGCLVIGDVACTQCHCLGGGLLF